MGDHTSFDVVVKTVKVVKVVNAVPHYLHSTRDSETLKSRLDSHYLCIVREAANEI